MQNPRPFRVDGVDVLRMRYVTLQLEQVEFTGKVKATWEAMSLRGGGCRLQI
jgi:hypothetical protein